MVFRYLFGKKERKNEAVIKSTRVSRNACQVRKLYTALVEKYPGKESVHTILLDKKQKARIVFRAYLSNNERRLQIHLRKWANGTRKDLPKIMILDVKIGQNTHQTLPIFINDEPLKLLVETFAQQFITEYEEKRNEELRLIQEAENVRLNEWKEERIKEIRRQEQAISEWRELVKNLA